MLEKGKENRAVNRAAAHLRRGVKTTWRRGVTFGSDLSHVSAEPSAKDKDLNPLFEDVAAAFETLTPTPGSVVSSRAEKLESCPFDVA